MDLTFAIPETAQEATQARLANFTCRFIMNLAEATVMELDAEGNRVNTRRVPLFKGELDQVVASGEPLVAQIFEGVQAAYALAEEDDSE